MSFQPSQAQAQEANRKGRPLQVELEGGVAFPGQADVQIPGNSGTRFSLTDTLKADAAPFIRGRLSYSIAERHTILALVAPFRFDSSGTSAQPIVFQDRTFAANTPIESKFKFDSYRLTYRYSLVRSEDLELALGATAKIRDASIELRQGDVQSKKDNVGFVPLLSFRLSYWFAQPLGIVLDGDALVAPQGRAEDVLAALQVRLAPFIALYGGYRVLEGGADNSEVYNFNLIHYAAFGVQAQL